ncbi:MAG: clostripain-related cysteine peptidase [Vicinamibacteraceae bacterium]
MTDDNTPGWTVMVYMAAADDPELDAHAVRDLQDMERAALQKGVRVKVQIDRHWPAVPQRYTITKGKSALDTGAAPAGETGTAEALLSFLQWASAEHPSDRLFLVLWGHAYGLGFGRDHGDPLTLRELGSTLRQFAGVDGRKRPLDLLGANACAMSYAEAAYEMRGLVNYMVASQIAVPFAGWPYEAILSSIGQNTSETEVGTIVADRYVNHFRASRVGDQVAMALLNLAPAVLDTFKIRLDTLTGSLAATLDQSNPMLGDRLDHIRSAFLATAAGDVRPLIDLYDLTDKLVDLCDDLTRLESCSDSSCGLSDTALVNLKTAATSLRAFLEPASDQISGEASISLSRELALEDTFVRSHKRHPDLDGLHGLGIFAPFVTDDADLKRLGLLDDSRPTDQRRHRKPLTARDEYAELALMKEGRWDTLVYERLSAGLPPDVITNIEGSGAVTFEDREAVSQMLAAVDSSFATLERRVAATRLIAMQIFAPAMNPDKPAKVPRRSASTQGRVGRFGTLRLMPREPLDEALKAKAKPLPSPAPAAPPDADVDGPSQIAPSDDASKLVDAYQGLEKIVADVERAVRRTVTNGSLGLGFTTGGGLGKRGLGKRGLGKRGLGKRGLGKRKLGGIFVKRKLGDDGIDVEMDALAPSTFEAATTSIVAGLFEEVGDALAHLEFATSEVERVSLDALAGPFPKGLTEEENHALSADAVRRAFRMLSEISTDARRTIRRVLAHPVYGFGPNADGLTAEDRRELARAGGLNGDELSLL